MRKKRTLTVARERLVAVDEFPSPAYRIDEQIYLDNRAKAHRSDGAWLWVQHASGYADFFGERKKSVHRQDGVIFYFITQPSQTLVVGYPSML